MNKKIPLWTLLLFVWLAAMGLMMWGWAVGHVYEGGYIIKGTAKEVILSISRFPNLVSQSLNQVFSEPPLILKDRYPQITGLKVHEKNYTDSNYLLITVYDKEIGHSSIKLIRLSDQQVMHRWRPDIQKIIEIRDKGRPVSLTSNKGNIVFWHPLLASDGSILFNTEDRALIKMDKNANIIWSYDGKFHHSQEFDDEGNIWASSVMPENPKVVSRYFDDYRDDALAELSATGQLLSMTSISQILIDNGYRGLLFGIGPPESDPIHLNDIQPALSDSEHWKKGDLLVSIRNKSTVFLYRPSTNKILWLQTGPWLNQHDADFVDNERISIFGNNILRNKNYDYIDGRNEVYVFNFKDQSLSTPYSEFLTEAKVKTMTGGRSEILENGNVFIEETDFGRMLMGDSSKTKWEYVERVDKESAGVLGWSRIVSAQEFETFNFIKKP